MKLRIWKSISGMGALALVFSIAPAAMAQCGLPNKTIKPSNWRPQYGATTPQLVLAALDGYNDHEPIVGMWHVVFTAQTQNGDAIPVPGGVVIDNSVVVWHGDGTEIMNSGRPAQDGNFCMGVWAKTGTSRYKLNHFALGNDTANAPGGIGNPAGPTQIAETIYLGADANSYHGRFVLDAYDPSGNNTAHIIGVITATRITVSTPVTIFF